jgi:hypothetical protein
MILIVYNSDKAENAYLQCAVYRVCMAKSAANHWNAAPALGEAIDSRAPAESTRWYHRAFIKFRHLPGYRWH